ncbi:hypothetical protein D3C87_1165130 [compost metagenome]
MAAQEQTTPNLGLDIGRLGDEFALRENLKKIDAAVGALEPGEPVPAGSLALLTAGTDTVQRTFSAKDIFDFVTAKIAAIP